MKNARIITALDIGSIKICAIIAVLNEEGLLEIKSVSSVPSFGIDAGVVKDINSTAQAISNVLGDAEDKAELPAEHIFASISGDFINSHNVQGSNSSVGHHNEPNEITESQIESAIANAKNQFQKFGLENSEILHTIPQFYEVDGQKDIINPVNMSGYHLTAHLHVVLAEKAAKQNLQKAIELAGYKPEQLVLSPVASGKAVLNRDEKNLGAILIDIGGGNTDIAVFYKGSIRVSSIIPSGGYNITKDIAVGLRTPMEYAENLKKEDGIAVYLEEMENEYVDVKNMGEDKVESKPKQLLTQFVQGRLQHILELTYQELMEYQLLDAMAAGIIITGGTSQQKGLKILAQQIFNKPVRIGEPKIDNFVGTTGSISSPEYSTAVGLLKFGLEKLAKHNFTKKASLNTKSLKRTFNNLFKKIINYF